MFATKQEVTKAVSMIDEDGSGDINWKEFAAWWQSDDKFSDFQHLLDDKAFYHDKSHAQGQEAPDGEVAEIGEWPSCLLHPYGAFRTVWDTVTAMAIVYSALLVPYRMAFEMEIETYDNAWWIDKMVDMIFIADMFLAFFTAYYDAETEIMVTDKGKIATQYLKSWFVPDFMASMPFDSLAAAFIFDDDEAGGEQAEQLRMLKMIRMLRLLKIMRMVKMSRLLTKFQETYQIKSGIMISVKFALICGVCAHYLASGWYVTSRLETVPWELCKLSTNWDTALALPELITCDPGGCPSINGCASLPAVGADANGTLSIVDDSTDTNVVTEIGWVLHQPFKNWVYRYFIGIQGGSEWIGDPSAHCLDCDLHEKFYWGRDDNHKWCERTGPTGCQLVPGAGPKTWPEICFTDDSKPECQCSGPCTAKFPLGHVPKAKIYAAAFYWSITTMTTLGYGEINGSDTDERYFVMMSIGIGCVVFAYGITNMCTLVANLDAQSLFAQMRSDEIIEWMTKKHIPPHLKKKVLQFFTYKTAYSKVFYYGGEDLLNELSNKLLMNVRQQTLLPVLWTSFLFARIDKEEGYRQDDEYLLFGTSATEKKQADRLMLMLAARLEGQVYAPSEYIAEAGTTGLGLYFMVGGSANLFDAERSSEPLRKCVAGFTYGEQALQYPKVRLQEWLQATSYCDFYFLSREDFHECCKKVRFKVKDWTKAWDILTYKGVEYEPETSKRRRTYDEGELPLMVKGIPDSELQLRVLRQQCVEQEDMIGQLVMNIDPLNNLMVRTPNNGVNIDIDTAVDMNDQE